MKPGRWTDDYTEVAAVPERGLVEVYVTLPGNSDVVSAHLSESLAWRLAWYLIRYVVLERLCGFKSWQEARRTRAELLKLDEDLRV
jgi:hypothetical protein